ncbi:hypothetical protein KP509_25G076000 [Ceratopteris richardii]|nr:hypothetical protein KP509_25G076000 [Ceratopteris richardii]
MQCQDLCNLMGREIVKRSCLAYALFKIFRRRLTNLRIHEKEEDFKTVRNVLLSLEVQHIRKVIDLELSFIFDAVYSKASSGIYYQGIGVITRLFTLTLLFTAVLDIIRLDKEHMPCSQSAEVPFGAGLANVLVIVALVVECLQIRKIVRSNWLRVWLVCNYVKQQNLGRSIKLHDFKRRAIACSFTYVGRPSSTHWKFRVGQLSILVDSLNLAWWHYIVQLEIEKACKVKNMQLQITNLLIDMDLEKLQDWLVCRMIKRSRALGKFRDICHLRQEIQVTFQRVQFNEVASLEDVILRFHVLTSLLESKLSDHSMILENNYVQITITLSRYCLHLMLKRPKLMPGDVDVAKFLYISVKQCLKDANIANVDKGRDLNFLCAEERKDSLPGMGLVDAEQQQQQTNTSVEDTSNGAVCGSNVVGENILEFARRVADETEVSNKAEWKLLADVWLDILMYIINASDNAEPHIKQMAKGGELLTHLWVLLEHLGPCNQRHKASSCTT